MAVFTKMVSTAAFRAAGHPRGGGAVMGRRAASWNAPVLSHLSRRMFSSQPEVPGSCCRNVASFPSRFMSGFMYRDHIPPKSVDWEKKGAVTFAQKQLGEDCWAHAAVGAVESIHAIKTGQLIKLSVQQVLNCKLLSQDWHTGGFPQFAFDYICENGLVSEDACPYVGTPGKCPKFDYAVATIDGYQFVPANNEFALKQAVANQPVCADIYLDDQFDDYHGGIADDMGSHGKLDHSTLLVGYGATSKGKKFWRVKDSYTGRIILIARDVGSKGGAFGIAKSACFPVKMYPKICGNVVQ